MGKKYSILFDSYHLYHLPQFEPLIKLLSDDKRFDNLKKAIPNQLTLPLNEHCRNNLHESENAMPSQLTL